MVIDGVVPAELIRPKSRSPTLPNPGCTVGVSAPPSVTHDVNTGYLYLFVYCQSWRIIQLLFEREIWRNSTTPRGVKSLLGRQPSKPPTHSSIWTHRALSHLTLPHIPIICSPQLIVLIIFEASCSSLGTRNGNLLRLFKTGDPDNGGRKWNRVKTKYFVISERKPSV